MRRIAVLFMFTVAACGDDKTYEEQQTDLWNEANKDPVPCDQSWCGSDAGCRADLLTCAKPCSAVPDAAHRANEPPPGLQCNHYPFDPPQYEFASFEGHVGTCMREFGNKVIWYPCSDPTQLGE